MAPADPDEIEKMIVVINTGDTDTILARHCVQVGGKSQSCPPDDHLTGPLEMRSVTLSRFRPEFTTLGGSPLGRATLVIAFVTSSLTHGNTPAGKPRNAANNPMQYQEPFPPHRLNECDYARWLSPRQPSITSQSVIFENGEEI
jgi:hypothetical protein